MSDTKRTGPNPIQRVTYVSDPIANLMDLAAEKSVRKVSEWLRYAAMNQLRLDLGNEAVDAALGLKGYKPSQEDECANA